MTPDFSWTEASPVRAVMGALNAAGEARFVGGCVRDSLLGRPPAPLAREGVAGTTDIDVATVLTPNETVAALRAAGMAAHPTGVEHGTVTAVADGLPIEVTTLRADVATDGRHAEVAFTTDWDQDWRRRDFRINAMYRAVDGTIYDPACGQEDLATSRVRFIGDPDRRIAEDYLRILRFFRFSARYADAPDQDGLDACARGAAGMARLSRERVWQEMAKLFTAPRAPSALLAAEEAGVLAQVLDAPVEIGVFGTLHHYLHADMPPALGLAALWPDAGLDQLRSAFKPSNETLARIGAAREAAARLTPNQGAELTRALYRHGRQAVEDAALLLAARHGDDEWLDLGALAARVAVPVLPVRGRDLVKHGLKPGPALGRALAEIESAWLAAGCPDDVATVEHIVSDVLHG